MTSAADQLEAFTRQWVEQYRGRLEHVDPTEIAIGIVVVTEAHTYAGGALPTSETQDAVTFDAASALAAVLNHGAETLLFGAEPLHSHQEDFTPH